jgi:hypothetical protein
MNLTATRKMTALAALLAVARVPRTLPPKFLQFIKTHRPCIRLILARHGTVRATQVQTCKVRLIGATTSANGARVESNWLSLGRAKAWVINGRPS